mmetsp:Transcript_7621/g.24397  ORF Transcript_7621/g.24397 Transcript_7621/m.24397 type:complete len:873 (-) Transcript_7621:1203-3821(-)
MGRKKSHAHSSSSSSDGELDGVELERIERLKESGIGVVGAIAATKSGASLNMLAEEHPFSSIVTGNLVVPAKSVILQSEILRKTPLWHDLAVNKNWATLQKFLRVEDGRGFVLLTAYNDREREKLKDHYADGAGIPLEFFLGAVGENLLHISMLLDAWDVAKELIQRFPEQLVNSVYLATPYSGETPMHLAIAKKKFDIVRLLLDHGAHVTWPRANGQFFRPPHPTPYTDGGGVVYYGESLFSFLICTGAVMRERHVWSAPAMIPRIRKELDDLPAFRDAIDLTIEGASKTTFVLLAEDPKEAARQAVETRRRTVARINRLLAVRPSEERLLYSYYMLNMRDSVGNAPLHLAVVFHDLDAFQWLLDNGAHTHPINGDGLTPLTLAVRLNDVAMFDFILSRQRTQVWTFGPVSCYTFALTELLPMPRPTRQAVPAKRDELQEFVQRSTFWVETIGGKPVPLEAPKSFEPSTPTPLVTVLDEVVDKQRYEFSMHPLLQHLHKLRWRVFARRAFFSYFAFVSLLVIAFSIFVWLKPNPKSGETTALTNFCEYFVLAGAVVQLLSHLADMFSVGFTTYFSPRWTLKPNVTSDGYSWGFLVTYIVSFFARRADSAWANVFTAISVIFVWLFLVSFARLSRKVGPMTIMIRKMIFGDFVRFGVVYAALLAGWSSAFYIGLARPDLDEDDGFFAPLTLAFTLFQVTFSSDGDFRETLATVSFGRAYYEVMYAIFLLVVGVLLMNLLIAMMSRTFSLISAQAAQVWQIDSMRNVSALETSFGAIQMSLRRRYERENALFVDDTPHPLTGLPSWNVMLYTYDVEAIARADAADGDSDDDDHTFDTPPATADDRVRGAALRALVGANLSKRLAYHDDKPGKK